MEEDFKVLGEMPPTVIAQKLRELGDIEAAAFYEQQSSIEMQYEGLFTPRKWLDTQHQYGFIRPFEPGTTRFHPLISATNMKPDDSLQNQRINIRLDWLKVHEYPPPLISFGSTVHTILFTFEARNQIEGGSEPIAFNQTYHARAGQQAAVSGSPIFIGLTVGTNGMSFSGETVHVGNSNDEQLISAMTSQTTTTGLHLLTTAQPALAPFVSIAKELGILLGKRWKNTPVQKFWIGLDFDQGAVGARLAVGSYVVAQVRRANEINWSDWSYDAETGTIVRTNLAEGEEPYLLPYNAIVFRVSKYRG